MTLHEELATRMPSQPHTAPGAPEATPEAPIEQLHERAEELQELADSETATAFGGDQRDMTGELTTVDQHPADVADFTFQRELQQTTREILDRERQQVEDALEAQAEGRYGLCQQCGQQISPERLEARPQATLCINCQRAAEASRPA